MRTLAASVPLPRRQREPPLSGALAPNWAVTFGFEWPPPPSEGEEDEKGMSVRRYENVCVWMQITTVTRMRLRVLRVFRYKYK